MSTFCTLYFHLTNLPHRFPDTPAADLEAWGTLDIEITCTEFSRHLLKVDWNLEGFIASYIEGAKQLFSDLPPFKVEAGQSLAQAMERVRYRENSSFDELDEVWENEFYNYSVVHDLWHWFGGMRIPAIILGSNGGKAEISCAEQPPATLKGINSVQTAPIDLGIWSYLFDAAEFQRHFAEQARNFLTTWISTAASEKARAFASDLLRRFDETLGE